MPILSVLVCTRNRSEKIQNLIDSVLDNSFADYELIIVDQSGDGKTRAVLGKYADSRIKYIQSNTVGLARSRNIAIRESKAEIVVFTDDDCICDKNWLTSIAAEYERDASLMGVYGRVLAYGKGQEGMICHCLMDSLDRRVAKEPVLPYEILGHGNNMSFKKDVFRKIGLYIESLGAGTWMKGGEDTELIYRALRNKMKFVYTPLPLVYHDNWMSLDEGAKLVYDYTLSGVAVFTKYLFKMDRNSFVHIKREGVEILRHLKYSLCHNGKEFMQPLKKLKQFVLGLVVGIKYLFISPPKLTT